jgi:FixJ family two-component response regulator
LATGETVRKRNPASYGQLTAQEKQIAQLAASRLTNSEIAVQLYISPRTVEWHPLLLSGWYRRRLFAGDLGERVTHRVA